jgi:hypothetical protein
MEVIGLPHTYHLEQNKGVEERYLKHPAHLLYRPSMDSPESSEFKMSGLRSKLDASCLARAVCSVVNVGLGIHWLQNEVMINSIDLKVSL